MRDINPVFMLSPENIKRYGCILFTQRNIRVNAIGMSFILIKKEMFHARILKKGQMLVRDIYACPSPF